MPSTEDIRPGRRYTLNLGSGDGRDGLLYVPRAYKPGVAAPLMVVLHGFAGTSQSAAYTFPLAEEFGIIILAPDSRDERTWDLLLGAYGPDVEFVGSAVGQTLKRCTIDRQRMAIAGHSDGASYALSLGIGAGDVFSRLIAFSPGVMLPSDRRGNPRIFISHGRSDRTMPIDDTSRKFVPRLKALGYGVTYHEYDGGHGVPPAIVREAFEWFNR